MATKLTIDVTRETAMEVEGKPVLATLSPDGGGQIRFRLKNARTESRLSIEDAYRMSEGIKGTVEPKPKTKPSDKEFREPTEDGEGDMVDLRTLEARLMIDGRDVMTPDVKGVLFDIIREIHEEAREEAGLQPVRQGTKRAIQEKAEKGHE